MHSRLAKAAVAAAATALAGCDRLGPPTSDRPPDLAAIAGQSGDEQLRALIEALRIERTGGDGDSDAEIAVGAIMLSTQLTRIEELLREQNALLRELVGKTSSRRDEVAPVLARGARTRGR